MSVSAPQPPHPPFAVSQLGYLVFEVSRLDAWEAFATQVLGLVVNGRGPDGALKLRMDRHLHRIHLLPGASDDLLAIGWEVASPTALDALADRLRSSGIALEEGTPAECEARSVARMVKLKDPAGVPLELYVGPAMAPSSAPLFSSPVVRAGFVADEQGLGHLVVTANSQAESEAFYERLLGFRLSDHIVCEYYGHQVDLAFLHTNRRHHSLAFGAQQQKRLHHFLVEVGSIDEVGLGFDRTLAAGHRIMQTIGRHPNDRMFSFYAMTPSGFQFEYGFGGRQVGEDLVPGRYDRISEWGHHPPAMLAPRKGK
jgi:biphenyl-2,3-diol 1,2-dioxygenase